MPQVDRRHSDGARLPNEGSDGHPDHSRHVTASVLVRTSGDRGAADETGEAGDVALRLGGGAGEFLPTDKGGRRRDGRDVLAELQGKGWELVRTKAELENAAAYRTGAIAEGLPPSEMISSPSSRTWRALVWTIS